MSYQQKILSSSISSLELDKEYIIYKNNLIDNNIDKLKNKIEELNNKIDFINNHNINVDINLQKNIENSIYTLENTIVLINRLVINNGTIKSIRL